MSGYVSNDVTVVIPCYNQSQFVVEAVKSVLANSIRPRQIHILLMDDQSWQKRTELEALSSTVQCYISKQRPLPTARNELIRRVTTPYFIPLDADDKLPANFIRQVLRTLPADVVYVQSQTFGDISEVWSNPASVSLSWLKKDNRIPNTALIKTDAWKAVGGYNEEFSFGYEDWEFWLHLLKRNRVFKKCASTMLLYRRHGDGLLHEAVRRRTEVIQLLKQLHPDIYRTKEDDPVEIRPDGQRSISRPRTQEIQPSNQAQPSASVAVIIPCYKQSHLVEEAVLSAINQTQKPDEILVLLMDEKSRRLQFHLESLSSIVRGISHEQVYLPAARNILTEKAHSQWIIPLDADDCISPTYIEDTVRRAHETEADVIYTDVAIFGKSTAYLKKQEGRATLARLAYANQISPTALIRRKIAMELRWDETFIHGYEDWEFWIRVAKAGHSIRYAPRAHLQYRDEGPSMVTSANSKRRELINRIRYLHPELYIDEISVIIPCYNQSAFVKETIQSVLSQTKLPIEIIVLLMDPRSWAMQQEIANMHPTIKALNINQRLLPAARNFGFGIAQGDRVIPIDADDKMPTNFIEELSKHSEDIVYVHAVYFDGEEGQWPPDAKEAVDWDLHLTFRRTSFGSCALIRRSAWERIGGYNETMESFEDLEFYTNARLQGCTFQKCYDTHLLYRKHPDSMSRWTWRDGYLTARRLHTKIMNIHFDHFNKVPKILHYAWMGPHPKPVQYINQWKKVLGPEWIFKEWNEYNFDLTQVPLAKRAYDAGAYAVASDVLRAVVLYQFGGVWFDTDNIVNEDISPFCQYDFFACYEDPSLLGAGVIGVSPHHPVPRYLIDYYMTREDTSFDPETLIHKIGTAPTNLTKAARYCSGLQPSGFPQTIEKDNLTYRFEPVVTFLIQDPVLNAFNYVVHSYKASWHGGVDTDSYGEQVKNKYKLFIQEHNITDWLNSRGWKPAYERLSSKKAKS